MRVRSVIPAVVAFLGVALCAPLAGQAATPVAGAADSLLERLVGSWRMTGHVRGRPVAYDLAAARVLARRFVELHMRDTARAPQYEARVFIGADTVPGRLLAHWLDSFGAAYSVPHGTGSVRGDTLVLEFPYRDGPFRDTFVFRRAEGRWHFLFEAGDGRGGWRTFGEYDVRPAAAERRP